MNRERWIEERRAAMEQQRHDVADANGWTEDILTLDADDLELLKNAEDDTDD